MLLILREELVCAIILLFLLFYYSTNKIKEKGQYFLHLVCIGLTHVVFDMVTIHTVNYLQVVPSVVNRILHILFYLTGILFARGLYSYTLSICSVHKKARLLEIMGNVPLPIFGALLLILPMEYVKGRWTNYSYGPLAFAGYAVFLIYCTACVLTILFSAKKLDTRTKWSVLPMFVALCAAVIAQALIPELLMTSASITFACVGMFVALDNPDKQYKKQALWDFLTGLKNRNSFDRDMAMYTDRYGGSGNRRRIGFLVADLNGLKSTNDNYGHVEGDRLLSTAAEVLRKNLKQAEHIYRIGGDEFVAVYLSPNDDSVAAEIENVRQSCGKVTDLVLPLEIAIGYSSGVADHHLEDIFRAADRLMYENKADMKQSKVS